MPRYKKAERTQMMEEARRRLLAAAIEEFAGHGYAAANINHIARAAGFAQGTIYNYFRGKRALFEAVVADIAARHHELILQGAATAPQPIARLERFFAAGFAFAQGFPSAAQMIAAALYGADADLRALVYRAYEPLLAYLEHEIVQAGLPEHLFRPVDARLASALILSVYLAGCSPAAESEPIRLNPRAVAALLLDGLRAEGAE